MERLREKLDLPRGHYYLHVAVLAGLPVSLISDLASELERSPAQIAQWITASPGSAVMSIQAGEVFCRLIEILDALLELYDGDLGGALHWLTAPNVVLSNERPVELLVTGFGTRAVRQASCHFASRGLPSENGFPRSLVSELLLTLACLLMNTKTNQGVAMKHRWNQEAMRMPPAEYFCLSASSISATYFSGAVLQGSPIS